MDHALVGAPLDAYDASDTRKLQRVKLLRLCRRWRQVLQFIDRDQFAQDQLRRCQRELLALRMERKRQ